MKKVLFVLFMAMCLFSNNAFAQEKVRGIETKLVKYDENKVYDIYGIQFTNYNSIPVSVTIELWLKGEKDKISQSKDIILKPNESYLWKIGKYKDSDGSLYGDYNSQYYYKYEAYKLQ